MSLAHITEYMAPTLANAVMALGLTCPPKTAHYLIRTLDGSKAGRRNPVSYGALNSATRGRFFMSGRQSMAAGVGSLTAGRTHSPVFDPASVRHPISVETDRGGYSSSYGVTAMSHDITKGEIRPAATRPVSLATLEKRLRRYLAKSACTLLKSRPGTKQYETLGQYSIFDEANELVAERINLCAWARSYGLLADDVPERWLAVIVPVVNEQAITIPHLFRVRSRHLTKPVRDAIRDGYQASGKSLEADVELMLTVTSGWRHILDQDGKELEFNRANIMRFLDCFPNALRKILDALLAEIAKGGEQDGSL